MKLYFTAPVPVSSASRIILRSQAKTYLPAPFEEKAEYVYSVIFPGPFPEYAIFSVEIPHDLTDDEGRKLAMADMFPLMVRTDSYPPLAKFSAKFGIIEKDEPLLPVTLRNVEVEVKSRMIELPGGNEKDFISKTKEIFGKLTGKIEKVESEKEIIDWFRRVHSAEREESILMENKKVKEFTVPKPEGEKAFEVIGIPLEKTGFYVVELESLLLGKALLGKPAPMYVQTSALVTNLSAHFKWGRESSVIWVTTLNTAAPVKDALVTVRNCKGEKLWEGKTDGQGIATIKEELPLWEKMPVCNTKGGLFVFAKTVDDMTFVHSDWDNGIEPWRFQLPKASYQGPVVAHTIFDRSLFRAGETVHMKHIMRKHTGSGFTFLKAAELPKAVVISHRGSNQSYQFSLKWDVANGMAETTWKIPQEAKLGSYDVVLLKDPQKAVNMDSGGGEGDEIAGNYWYSNDSWPSGLFRVEEFKIPLMKGTIQPLSGRLINPDGVDVDLSVSYLSGGGAMDIPVKLRSQVRRHRVQFKDYEGFSFATGMAKEGIIKEEPRKHEAEVKEKNIQTAELVLENGGVARARITNVPKESYPQEVLSELEFKDPNGLIQTVSKTIPLWPSSIVIGIKTDYWVSTPESLKFHVLALDLEGKPIPGAGIKVDLYKRNQYSHRKRLIGGFYSYEDTEETRKIGPLCEGKTDTRGLLICEVKSPVTGEVLLQASSTDPSGNLSSTYTSVWVAGKEEWWFGASDSDRIDVLPERRGYEPGETARFQVRMPFRDATALIAVEREGILDTYVRKISGQNPVVDIPVKGNYAPNVFVSVLCVRGRIGENQPTALVDLGKPAFKLGISEVNVGWKAHELMVKVTADKDTYKTREKAQVHIRVRKADGKPLDNKGEVALAAVDDGLLELWENKSWNLIDEMMQRRGYEVKTATAQMQVVGKRHYGLKALAQGGGGGKKSTRELFDTLLLWRGRVELDSSGEAFIEVPLNDSLTSFRIVAVASSGADLFGTGETTIQTTQDLILMSELPSMVREGDIFKAGFTVKNATNRRMDVEVKAKITQGKDSNELEPVKVTLDPGKAKEEGWELKVPSGAETLKWEVSAREINGSASDAFRVSQEVKTAFPVRVYQATLLQLDRRLDMKVEKQTDAIPGKGELRVSLRPRLSDDLNGVIDYMRRYPYICMEQKVSKAVALRDEEMWKTLMKDLPSYMDSDGLVKYFPSSRLGSDVLTSYLLSISNEADYEIPANLKEKMEKALKGFIEGRMMRRSELPTADVSIRKMTAVEALSRGSMFDPRLLDSISIEPNRWPTSAVIDWLNVLKRQPAITNRDGRLKEAEQILRSRLNIQGTTMGFSTEKTDYLWWLMVSTDVNAVRTILSLVDYENWREDMPRLVRGALGRQIRGTWGTTVANAWGVLAMEKFSRKFDAEKVVGRTSASIGDSEKSLEWARAPQGDSFSFILPVRGEDLVLSHLGDGKPWVTIQSLAAIPVKKPASTGYKIIEKSYMPVIQKEKERWSVGDVVRVKLDMEAQSDMTWVVVNDPVPAGASILGTGLGRDSALLTQGERYSGWVWPLFEERSFEAFRAYYQVVPKGRWSLEYTIRFNNKGTYQLPETRVEALYAPEMFGEIPNKVFSIEQ